MALQNQGILGNFTGRVGNVVGRIWRGRQVLASRPSVQKERIFNEAQRLAQARLVTLTKTLAPLAQFFRFSFANVPVGTTAYALALKKNSHLPVLNASGDGFSMSLADAILGNGVSFFSGKVAAPSFAGGVAKVSVSGLTSSHAQSVATAVAVVNLTKGASVVASFPEDLSKATASHEVPIVFDSGDSLFFASLFFGRDGKGDNFLTAVSSSSHTVA